MMSHDFTPEDLPLLNAAMRVFPHIGIGFRAMLHIASRLSFPVESSEALQRVVAEIAKDGYTESLLPIDSLPLLMPVYYFPIESVEDFFAKVSDVTSRLREPEGPGMGAARLREANAPRRAEPPTISNEEVMRQADAVAFTAPSVGGISKR